MWEIKNKTANGKWNGSDNTRSITFSGFDLRRGDLSDVIENINNTKAFTAGENDAYLLYDASEAALYDMYLFVHFAEEQLVVKARVGCGITDEEIRSIAAAMRIEETDDAALALPISNELTTENQNNDPLFSFEEESQVIHRTTLLSVGESAHYDGVFGDHKEITVDSIEVLDNISTLDQTGFTSRGLEMLSSFTDNGGNFITYMRTEIDRERGVFGETTETEKRFVLVSVTFSGAEGEGDAKSFMQTFHLSSCIDGGNGTVLPWYAQASYVIDKNPGRYAGTTEPIYRLYIGNGRYLIGYILDEEISKQTLLLHSSYAEIGYILETE